MSLRTDLGPWVEASSTEEFVWSVADSAASASWSSAFVDTEAVDALESWSVILRGVD